MNLKTKNKLAGTFLFRLTVAVILGAAPACALAEGFRNSTIGTSDLGYSGGRIAQVNDATAVQNNPANLIDVTNAQLSFTPSVIYINVDYKSADGQSATTIHPWKFLPNFFAAMPVMSDRLVAGLGITVPFGLGNQWKSSSSAFRQPTGGLAYTTPNYSELLTINVNPSLAYKVTDSIRVGAGLDVMWSSLEFSQFLPSGAPPALPNLSAHITGHGVGVGGNMGISWLVTDKQTLSLTYRSTMTVDYSGTAGFYNYPGTPSTSFHSQVKYPNIIGAGYGIKLTDTVSLGTDFEWLQFSQFKNLPIKLGANALGVPSQNIAEDWHNTFTAGIGASWQFAEHWVLRGGYEYFETPVPESTFSPTIPDSNQNVLTIGIGWKYGHHSLEASYGQDFYSDRTITHDENPAFDGKYTFNVHLISLAYDFSF
jgi:long-chain fatty acid transport protein